MIPLLMQSPTPLTPDISPGVFDMHYVGDDEWLLDRNYR